MESVIRRSFYDDVEDASDRARSLAHARNLRKGTSKATSLRVDSLLDEEPMSEAINASE